MSGNAAMGIEEVVTAPRSPWQNPYVERVIGSIRRECLNHVIVVNERHLRGSFHPTSTITIDPGLTCRLRRTARNHVWFIRPIRARSSLSHKSAACIIVTNGSPPNLCGASSLTPHALGNNRSAYCQPMSPDDCSAGRNPVSLDRLPDYGGAIMRTPPRNH